MPNTALNRTTQSLLTNKSGGNLNYGDVVVLDNTNANGFTTTTTAGLSTRGLGVILEPNGIANNASGMVAVGGWCPKVNLNTAAAVGQFIKTHTVAGQGTPHTSPQVEGDFAVALSASATPPCNLFGSPNGPLAGGSGTVTHTAGALTASAVVVGNGTDDIKVLASLGTTTTVLHGNAAGLPTYGAVDLTADVTGVLPGLKGGGLVLLEQHTASSSATLDFTTCITSSYDDYVFRIVGILPATDGANLKLLASTDGGSTWLAGTTYKYGISFVGSAGSSGTAETSNGASTMQLAGGIENTTGTSVYRGSVDLSYPLSATRMKPVSIVGEFQVTDGNYYTKSGGGAICTTTAVNAIQFKFDSGNIAEGTIRCYGWAK